MVKLPSLTLFGRSLLLLVAEFLANTVLWVVAAILFVQKQETREIMSMALLAWTLGLRHALDADHISAIDNATRNLISLGQLPVTCGLFFSLGHSSIVFIVTIAIAISADVYDRLGGVGEVGGIVGAAVAGSFLFIVGLANSVILWRILKRRKKQSAQEKADFSDQDAELSGEQKQEKMFMLKIIGPIINFVNKPWKMYPVGLLFGFGFDTASSIALIAISSIAKRESNGTTVPSSHIIILPLLFTAGMTLLDSIDSIIMLYSYTGFPEKRWRIFETKKPVVSAEPVAESDIQEKRDATSQVESTVEPSPEDHVAARTMTVKMNVMSNLSITLTVLSILVAFSISLITIISLIGENCTQCVEAAEAEDGGGLAGSWWRGWANAAEQSGWIGIAIVGAFIVIVGGWYAGRWIFRRYKKNKDDREIS
ncbi:NicO-domain-containing protein [Coprinopsis marcescibilis]|uniref:Nickel/cobalt efflux system n=1 Tax=Coprinopsis marcescibilis TaxID=230819 RepID=A0A5C3L7M1_COPMA|nr:NicO-domain-containing protein [Coprinopsis marcescibilis]